MGNWTINFQDQAMIDLYGCTLERGQVAGRNDPERF